jgi:hypothetical protein
MQMTIREQTARCERCGNPVTEREAVWITDTSGRLRIATLATIERHEQSNTRFWHTGCLHTIPSR